MDGKERKFLSEEGGFVAQASRGVEAEDCIQLDSQSLRNVT